MKKKLANTTWDNVNFGNFPLTKKDIEKADDAFWTAYNHITNLCFNGIEEAKPIREAMEKARNSWQMLIVGATKKAITSWNNLSSDSDHKHTFLNGVSCDICGKMY